MTDQNLFNHHSSEGPIFHSHFGLWALLHLSVKWKTSLTLYFCFQFLQRIPVSITMKGLTRTLSAAFRSLPKGIFKNNIITWAKWNLHGQEQNTCECKSGATAEGEDLGFYAPFHVCVCVLYNRQLDKVACCFDPAGLLSTIILY